MVKLLAFSIPSVGCLSIGGVFLHSLKMRSWLGFDAEYTFKVDFNQHKGLDLLCLLENGCFSLSLVFFCFILRLTFFSSRIVLYALSFEEEVVVPISNLSETIHNKWL